MAAKKTAKGRSKSMKDLKPRKRSSQSVKGGFSTKAAVDGVKEKLTMKYGPYR